MREMKLFCVFDDEEAAEYVIDAIHDEAGYRKIRAVLADQYNLSTREPNIQVVKVDLRGDRSITLGHDRHNNVPLGESCPEVLKHVHLLWGFDVYLESYDGEQFKHATKCLCR